jgi:hypothetical protein
MPSLCPAGAFGAEALSNAELLAVLVGAERLEDCWMILSTVGSGLPGIGSDRAAWLKVAANCIDG